MLQHHLPFRHTVSLQLYMTVMVVRVARVPVTKLLLAHPKLTSDAQWLCNTAQEGIAIMTGTHSVLHERLASLACQPEDAATRCVLTAQIMFMFFIPLLVVYILESQAKLAFIEKQRPYGQQQAPDQVERRLDWHTNETSRRRSQVTLVYVVFLLGGIVLTDLAVDAMRWLAAGPAIS